MSEALREMPPLIDLDVYPLHPRGKRSAWAHQVKRGILPDLDEYVIEWDWRCRRCIQKAEEYVAAGIDPDLPWTRTAGVEPVMVRLSVMAARSRHYWFQTVQV